MKNTLSRCTLSSDVNPPQTPNKKHQMKKHQKFYGLFHYATGKRIWNPNNFPTPRAGSYIVATRITSADKKAREAGWVPNGTTYIVEKLITLGQEHSTNPRFSKAYMDGHPRPEWQK